DELSYRKLYEYAASIYPVAEAQIEIARWYARRLLASKGAATSSNQRLSDSTVLEDKNIIGQRLSSANEYIDRLKTQPDSVGGQIADAMLHKADVLGTLNLYGSSDFGNAEDVYKGLLTGAFGPIQIPGGDTLVRYKYAVYLTRSQGASAADQIKNILNPLYAVPMNVNEPAFLFLQHALSPQNAVRAPLIVTIDPRLKSFLMQLGWRDTDFQTDAHSTNESSNQGR